MCTYVCITKTKIQSMPVYANGHTELAVRGYILFITGRGERRSHASENNEDEGVWGIECEKADPHPIQSTYISDQLPGARGVFNFGEGRLRWCITDRFVLFISSTIGAGEHATLLGLRTPCNNNNSLHHIQDDA